MYTNADIPCKKFGMVRVKREQSAGPDSPLNEYFIHVYTFNKHFGFTLIATYLM